MGTDTLQWVCMAFLAVVTALNAYYQRTINDQQQRINDYQNRINLDQQTINGLRNRKK